MNETHYDFSTTLADLDAGVFLQKVSKAIRDTAMATIYNADSSKTGKVTIDLIMRRIGDSNQITLEHSIKFQKPTRRGKAGEEDTTHTPLYVDKSGALSVMPYNQTDFFEKLTQGERT